MLFFEKLIIVALGGLLFYAFLPVWQIAVCYMLCCMVILLELPLKGGVEDEQDD